jgi:hypothetical protein
VNAQSSSGPPLAVGTEYDVQLHVDDSGDNFWSGTVVITAMNDYTVDIENQALVAYGYTFKTQGALTPNGTLAALAS